MYRFVFEDDSYFDVEGYQSVKIGLAGYTGQGQPRYMYLWFKKRFINKEEFKKWELFFYHKKLKSVLTYTEDCKSIKYALSASEPFINLYYEEGDLIVTFGDQLYSDEAY